MGGAVGALRLGDGAKPNEGQGSNPSSTLGRSGLGIRIGAMVMADTLGLWTWNKIHHWAEPWDRHDTMGGCVAEWWALDAAVRPEGPACSRLHARGAATYGQ